MSPLDDDKDVRSTPDEQLLAGEPVPAEPELSSFVAALRATAQDEPPAPSAALSALLRDGLPAGAPVAASGTVLDDAPGDALAGGAPRSDGLASVSPLASESQVATVTELGARRGTGRTAWRRVGAVAGTTLALKIAIGVGAAAAAVLGAAHSDQVPAVIREPAQTVVDGVAGVWAGITGQDSAPAEETGPGRVPQAPPATTPACDDRGACDEESPAGPAPRVTPQPSAPATPPGLVDKPTPPNRPVVPTPPGRPDPDETPGRSDEAPGQDVRPTRPARPTPTPPERGRSGDAGSEQGSDASSGASDSAPSRG